MNIYTNVSKMTLLQGNLKCSENFLPKRSFAKNLGISVITVENAYEQLMAEGYIYSIPKERILRCRSSGIESYKRLFL